MSVCLQVSSVLWLKAFGKFPTDGSLSSVCSPHPLSILTFMMVSLLFVSLVLEIESLLLLL